MGEGLREVSQMPARARLDLLGVEVQRAGERKQPLTKMFGAADLADLDQSRYQPKRADGECAFLTDKPVVGLLDAVPQHQTLFGELIGNGQHSGPHPRVVRRQEASQHHLQQRGVQPVAAVALGEHAPRVHALSRISALISSATARHCCA